MLLRKNLNNTNSLPSRKDFFSVKGKAEQLMALKKDEIALYLDACYLLSAISAGIKPTELVERLSEKATVVLIKSVIDEVQGNLAKAEFSHVNRSAALADIQALYSLSNMNPYVVFDSVEVSDKDFAELSAKMKSVNPSGNCRVGLGEASIYKHFMAVKDLFKAVFIASNDADVGYIFEGIENVYVFGA
ncbi:MAG: hypothetical protein QXS93_02395 [Candidatus Micrarchaeia archaeon]